MVDDTYYITPHEAALAVVATAMKKSRLKWDTLIINSIIGAFLFTAGGMLDLMCQAQNQGLVDNEMMGIINLFQGAVYSIGLFFVISMGMELFNSNILFFSVGVCRGAVTIMDLFISWFVSFWVNLGATIFVVYLFCHVSGVTSTGNYVRGSIEIAETKESFTFMQTFLKGIAGNFFVCLAVYLQIMVKPLHVKLIMIFLPIFTFVAMGFTHVVADMFLIPAGLFNHCNFSWGTYFWKLLIPASLGNIVGGSFFGVVVPWYLHLVVIERDMRQLQLPEYDERDEQPLLNMDSRVVRTARSNIEPAEQLENYQEDDQTKLTSGSTSGDDDFDEKEGQPVQLYNPNSETTDYPVSRVSSRATTGSNTTSRTTTPSRRRSKTVRSPKGVFPVYDMGPALRNERSIASAYSSSISGRGDSSDVDDDYQYPSKTHLNDDIVDAPAAEKLGDHLTKVLTRARARVEPDIESLIENDRPTNTPIQLQEENIPSPTEAPIAHTISRKVFKHFSFGGGGSDANEIGRRMSAARITKRAANMANDIAGIPTQSIDVDFHNSQSNLRASQKSDISNGSNVSSKKVRPNSSNDNNKAVAQGSFYNEMIYGGDSSPNNSEAQSINSSVVPPAPDENTTKVVDEDDDSR